MFVLVLRTLFGALVAWVLLGALIGIAAALWKRFPVIIGVFVGALLGPLAFLMFSFPAYNRSEHGGGNASRPAGRCCPVCPDPNDLLIWQGLGSSGPRFGDFVEPLPTHTCTATGAGHAATNFGLSRFRLIRIRRPGRSTYDWMARLALQALPRCPGG